MDWIQLRSLVRRCANKMSSNLQFHVTDLISKSWCTQSSWASQLTFMFNYWRWKIYLKIKSNLQFHVTDLISPIPLFARSHIWLLSGSTTCNISRAKETDDAPSSPEQKWKKTMCPKWEETGSEIKGQCGAELLRHLESWFRSRMSSIQLFVAHSGTLISLVICQ